LPYPDCRVSDVRVASAERHRFAHSSGPGGCICFTCACERQRRGAAPLQPLWAQRLAQGLSIHGRPSAEGPRIRVLTVVVCEPDDWRFLAQKGAHLLKPGVRRRSTSSETRGALRLADLGDARGLPVGRVVDQRVERVRAADAGCAALEGTSA
jgi:hypothetical protein